MTKKWPNSRQENINWGNIDQFVSRGNIFIDVPFEGTTRHGLSREWLDVLEGDYLQCLAGGNIIEPILGETASFPTDTYVTYWDGTPSTPAGYHAITELFSIYSNGTWYRWAVEFRHIASNGRYIMFPYYDYESPNSHNQYLPPLWWTVLLFQYPLLLYEEAQGNSPNYYEE